MEAGVECAAFIHYLLCKYSCSYLIQNWNEFNHLTIHFYFKRGKNILGQNMPEPNHIFCMDVTTVLAIVIGSCGHSVIQLHTNMVYQLQGTSFCINVHSTVRCHCSNIFCNCFCRETSLGQVISYIDNSKFVCSRGWPYISYLINNPIQGFL